MSKSLAPIGWRICSEPALITPYMAWTGASSKIHRLCRGIFNRRKILIERLERCKNCQERSGRRRLDNEPLSFFSDNCVLSRQLEFARNSYSLIPPILEKFDVPLTHRYLIAYALAYVKASDRINGACRGALPGPIRDAFAVRLSAKAKKRSAPHPLYR